MSRDPVLLHLEGRLAIVGLMVSLHFDCTAGIAGDMVLAALLDLDLDPNELVADLKLLNLDGWDLRLRRVSKHGISAHKVDVTVEESHHHRSFATIRSLILDSGLPQGVKDDAVAIFRIVAEAEGRVHGEDPEEVHFHEVGAMDSIIDIVGTAVLMGRLAPAQVTCSPIELGGGFVKAAHGLLPVPAPAVAAILEGVPVTSGRVQYETCTPTGAAIAKYYAGEFVPGPSGVLGATGYGAGTRDGDIPNLLRVMLYESSPAVDGSEVQAAVVIECNVDDMIPEDVDDVVDRLFLEGAKDVTITPVQMKKNRPGWTLSVLADPREVDRLAAVLFENTTTLGLREYPVRQRRLPRQHGTVNTSYGPIRVKTARRPGGQQTVKAEYDDLKRIARERGMSVGELRRRIRGEIDA